MSNDDLKAALKASNESKTERLNELQESLDALEAREFLADVYDTDPEEFEGMSNETVEKLAHETRKKTSRMNTHPGGELQGAIAGNVGSIGRAEWEAEQGD